MPIFFIGNDTLRMIAHQLTLLMSVIFSYLAFFRYRDDDQLNNDYRRKVIPKLLNQLNAKYKYYPRAKILAKEFLSSGLYYSKLNKIYRHDLVLGLVNKASFSMSFIKAQKREFIGKSGITGTQNTTMITKFQGLHYVFKVPINFSGKTLILPLAPTNSKEVDDINNHNLIARSNKKSTSRYKTANEKFDREFAVFTSLEKEAADFLTPKRIKAKLEINELFNNSIAMSFSGAFVFLHAHTNQEVFKVDIAKPIDVDQVANNYLNLRIALKAVWLLLR